MQERAHGRRDLALLWGSVIFVSWLTLLLRTGTFAGQANARLLLRVARPLTSGDGRVGGAGVARGWPGRRCCCTGCAMSCAPSSRCASGCRGGASSRRRWRYWRCSFVHGPIVGYRRFGGGPRASVRRLRAPLRPAEVRPERRDRADRVAAASTLVGGAAADLGSCSPRLSCSATAAAPISTSLTIWARRRGTSCSTAGSGRCAVRK